METNKQFISHIERQAFDQMKHWLDAMPLSCHLWNRDVKMFDCNEMTKVLFEVKDKQYFLDHFFDFSPEYQPDGQPSVEKAKEIINNAFAEGKVVLQWMHKLSDGTPLPTEVTLVRIEHENDFVVASYTRDLRHDNQMICEVKENAKLLKVINDVASVLLKSSVEDDFEKSLYAGMELIGICLETDIVEIWENEIHDGSLHFTLRNKWLSGRGKKTSDIPIGTKIPYSATADWEEKFLHGEYINGPISTLPPKDQDLLYPLGLKSTITIPLFSNNELWGCFCLDDCDKERFFNEDEGRILNSAGMLLINAINNNAQAAVIQEAHKRATTLLDATPVSASLWNKDGFIFDCNEESFKLFGLKDKKEFMARFFELSPQYQPDGQRSSDAIVSSIKRTLEKGKDTFEWMHQMIDGTPIPVEVTLVSVSYGNDYAVARYIRDLREQKKREAELKCSHELNELQLAKLNLVVKGAKIGLWDLEITDKDPIDPDDEYIWSDDFRQMLGYSNEEDFPNVLCSWSDLLHPEDKNATFETFVKHIRDTTGKSPFDVEYRLLTKDGEYRHYRASCETTRDKNGKAIRTAGALMDITETKNTLREMEEHRTAADAANKAKSYFLSTMSHEMRTPLNAVIGLSSLTLEIENLNESTYTNLEKIYNSGATLLSTVNDILDISKIEAGRLDFVLVDYDMPSLINDTLTQNMTRIGEKPIKLVLNIDEDLFARLHGDELRIKQICNNLLSNAIKYTKEGAVELAIRCERDGETVWMNISVRDSGIGIKPEDIGKLFKDYAQLEIESNRKIEGTGLGLTITKRLVEMMDGTITVESEYGKGSVFTVRLRQGFVTDTRIGSSVAENLRSFRYSDNKRLANTRLSRVKMPYAHVLVVDDNLTNLDVARGMMKPYSMCIDCLTDGQSAIDAISDGKIKYSAIFMDHMMPGMDGIEATERIRAIDTGYAKNIPIIALTANAIIGNEQMFLSKGFNAFLSKPIDMGRLDEILRRFIRDKEKELEAQQTENEKYLQPDNRSGRDRRSAMDRRKPKTLCTGLDVKEGMRRFDGNEETYLNVIRSFAVNNRPLLERITEVTKDNLDDYGIIVHGLKGSSRGICADKVGDLAEELEHAAKAGDYAYVSAHNSTFIGYMNKLMECIDEMLNNKEAKNQKQIKNKPDRELLEKLITAGDHYEMDTADALMDELEVFEYTFDSTFMQWLRLNVSQANFAEIKEKVLAMYKEEF